MRKLFIIAMLLSSVCISINAQGESGGSYKGFVDVGYGFGIGDYDFGRFQVNTTHGYQISPYFFVGAGAGLHFMSSYKTSEMDIPLDIRDSQVDIPIFANARCNFLKGRISPFLDLKGGTYVTNNGGLYVNFSAGCRIATKGTQAFNVSIGYSNEKLEFQTFHKFVSSQSMDYTRVARSYNTESISLKIGYEF